MEVSIKAQGEHYQVSADADDGSGPTTFTAESELDAISAAWQYLVDRGIDDEEAENECRRALGLG